MNVEELMERLGRISDKTLEVRVEYPTTPPNDEHHTAECADIRELRVERPATARRYVIIEAEGGE